MTSAATRILPRLALYTPVGSILSSKRPAGLLSVCQSLHRAGLFSGIEASLNELGVDATEQRESAQWIQDQGLELLVNIEAECVKSFESQLSAISNLGEVVAHITCRSHVEKDEALDYLLDVLPLSAEFLEDHSHIGRHGNETDIMGGAPDHLIGISHETIGIFCQPKATRHLLEVVPPVRLTMDLWHKASGLPWGSDGEEAEALSIEIVPHIDLIRAKTSLCVNEEQYLRSHQLLWKTVWTRKVNRGVEQLYMTLDIDDHGINFNDGNDYASRIQRLTTAASSIHDYYKEWSTSVELETQSSS